MFISFEGPEGGGKTTQIRLLAEFLHNQGFVVCQTREPGGTIIGDQVRQVLMRMDNSTMHPRTETLLFLAARAQLVNEVIRPALSQNEIVLSDRYADSTIAYQYYGHCNQLQASLDEIQQMLDFATGKLYPDLTILLDLDVKTGLGRKQQAREWNRLDAYTVAFHQNVRAGYHLLAQNNSRWAIVDANQPLDVVQNAIRAVVIQRLKSDAEVKHES